MFSWAAFIGTVLLLPTSVFSFGTIQGSGQNSEHERITRVALACAPGVKSNGECFEPISLDNLAGKAGTFGAVGSPDGSGSVAIGEAHCDNADFLNIPGYPQTRAEANRRLTDCRVYLTDRMLEGITNAIEMLNEKDQIIESEVDDESCTFGPVPNSPGDAKCEALEGFGRALHGVQDIYSHSNWADQANTSAPISIINPPGLANAGVIPWMDLRQRGAVTPDEDFSTGCFLDAPNVICHNRVTHETMNKDKGIITVPGGATSAPGTTRGQINGGANFGAAVAGAIADSVRLWRVFRSEVKRTYGDRIGNKLICAMTRDDPVKDCQGRHIAIVIDSSGSNIDTDPSNNRIAAGQAFNAQLVSAAAAGSTGKPDLVTVVDFDSSARVIYPLGDPGSASFAGIDSSGGTCIGCGLRAALNELTKDPDVDLEDRGGVVILTDGQDGNSAILNSELQRAASLGIRVNFGFLAPPPNPVPRKARRSLEKRQQQFPTSTLSGLLATGGIYAIINSPEAQQNFITLVNAQGPTNIDGSGDPITFLPDLVVAGLISHPTPRYFNYNARSGETFTILIGIRDSQQLKVKLVDIRTGDVISEGLVGGGSSDILDITITASKDLELELEITAEPETSNSIFTVGLDTDAPTLPPVSSSMITSSSTVSSSLNTSSTVGPSSVSGSPSLTNNVTSTMFTIGTGTGSGDPVRPTESPLFPTTATVQTTIITTTTITMGKQTITITKGDGATTCITRSHTITATYTQTLKCNGKCHSYKTVHVPASPFPSDGLPPPRKTKCNGERCPNPSEPTPCHGPHCKEKCHDSVCDNENDCKDGKCKEWPPQKTATTTSCTTTGKTHTPPLHPPETTHTPPPSPKTTIVLPPHPLHTTCTECTPPIYSHPPSVDDCKKHNNCYENTTTPKDKCGDGGCNPEVEQFTGVASSGKGAIGMATVVSVVMAVIGMI